MTSLASGRWRRQKVTRLLLHAALIVVCFAVACVVTATLLLVQSELRHPTGGTLIEWTKTAVGLGGMFAFVGSGGLLLLIPALLYLRDTRRWPGWALIVVSAVLGPVYFQLLIFATDRHPWTAPLSLVDPDVWLLTAPAPAITGAFYLAVLWSGHRWRGFQNSQPKAYHAA